MKIAHDLLHSKHECQTNFLGKRMSPNFLNTAKSQFGDMKEYYTKFTLGQMNHVPRLKKNLLFLMPFFRSRFVKLII